MTKLQYAHSAESESAHGVADPRIPTLQAVLDPSEFAKYLFPILPPRWGEVRYVRTKVLQHRPRKRCTVSITLQTTSGQHELIGKVYAKDRSDVYRAMKDISRAGFGAEEEFSIPEPFAFIPELHLLLQEKVYGQSGTEIFSKGSEREHVLAAERCAKWLAHFHALGPTSAPVFVLTHALLEDWRRRLARWAQPQAGQLRDKAGLLFERLRVAATKLEGLEMCACHGGFCYQQVILTESRTVTLDWDDFCVTHPSLDLARFIVVLQQLALNSHGSLKALDTAIQVFCSSYTAISRFDVTKDLPFYRAAHCLRRAKKHLEPDSSGIEKAEAMLDEGLRVLTGEV